MFCNWPSWKWCMSFGFLLVDAWHGAQFSSYNCKLANLGSIWQCQCPSCVHTSLQTLRLLLELFLMACSQIPKPSRRILAFCCFGTSYYIAPCNPCHCWFCAASAAVSVFCILQFTMHATVLRPQFSPVDLGTALIIFWENRPIQPSTKWPSNCKHAGSRLRCCDCALHGKVLIKVLCELSF